jgi:hypothetical protein
VSGIVSLVGWIYLRVNVHSGISCKGLCSSNRSSPRGAGRITGKLSCDQFIYQVWTRSLLTGFRPLWLPATLFAVPFACCAIIRLWPEPLPWGLLTDILSGLARKVVLTTGSQENDAIPRISSAILE